MRTALRTAAPPRRRPGSSHRPLAPPPRRRSALAPPPCRGHPFPRRRGFPCGGAMTTQRHGTNRATGPLPRGTLHPAAPRRTGKHRGSCGDPPGPLQEICRLLAQTLQGIWPAPRAITVISTTLPGGYLGGMGRGCHLATSLRALDEWRPICRYCRRRLREFKGLDDWSRERKFRVLCATCLRE